MEMVTNVSLHIQELDSEYLIWESLPPIMGNNFIHINWHSIEILIEDLDCNDDGKDAKHRDCCVDSDWNHLNDAITWVQTAIETVLIINIFLKWSQRIW